MAASRARARGRRAGLARTAQRAGTAPVFAALGDATRLKIVARLSEGGPASIVRLTDVAPVSRQAITKHLRSLERAGLVHSRRAGRESLWALRPERLGEARGYLDQISRGWDAALGRLRTVVERGER